MIIQIIANDSPLVKHIPRFQAEIFSEFTGENRKNHVLQHMVS
jgi:hypothetical protein